MKEYQTITLNEAENRRQKLSKEVENILDMKKDEKITISFSPVKTIVAENIEEPLFDEPIPDVKVDVGVFVGGHVPTATFLKQAS